MSGVQTMDNCTCTFVLKTCENSDKDRVDQLLRRTHLTWLIPWKVWARVFNLRTSSSAPISSPIWRTRRVHDKKTIAREERPGDCHNLERGGVRWKIKCKRTQVRKIPPDIQADRWGLRLPYFWSTHALPLCGFFFWNICVFSLVEAGRWLNS